MWVVGEEQVFDEGEEEGGRWTNRGGAEGEDEGGRMVYKGEDEGGRMVYEGEDEGGRMVYEGEDEGESMVYEGEDEGERMVYEGEDERERMVYEGEDEGGRMVYKGEDERGRMVYEGEDEGGRMVYEGEDEGGRMVYEGEDEGERMVYEGERMVYKDKSPFTPENTLRPGVKVVIVDASPAGLPTGLNTNVTVSSNTHWLRFGSHTSCRLWGQVTNPGGRLYREVEVVVKVPLRLTILPRTAEVTQGERFVVKCEAVGVPVPSISWLLNAVENCHQCSQPVSAEVLAVVGQEVKLSCEVTGHPSPTLTWARPDQTRASSQSLGGRLYREVEVVVEVPLRLTILPRTAEVTQGERFVVKCEAVGVPVPSINWLLNAIEVIGAQVVDEGEVIP
ncbi:hypothetical protein Pcinc_023748 [Petrolisthes cinctipes]|uniref:Ig-like domain-containing protein n=1 Tax=Petrolisthes cinctipes TaxID=88211 RepID=A0AAE1KEQ7_PETCI|nr:hypothetical protein Pcinc_023748 [Petrolisthes cinctipes]